MLLVLGAKLASKIEAKSNPEGIEKTIKKSNYCGRFWWTWGSIWGRIEARAARMTPLAKHQIYIDFMIAKNVKSEFILKSTKGSINLTSGILLIFLCLLILLNTGIKFHS